MPFKSQIPGEATRGLSIISAGVSHLRLFLDATADLAPTTLARRKAALRSCFVWAYQQELLPAVPPPSWKPFPSASATRVR